jgi:hypothetical protein
MKKLFQVAALVLLAALSTLSAVGVYVVGSALSNLSAPRRAHAQAGYLGPIDCPPFTNVVQNGLATVDLQNLLGRTVERIILELGGAGNTKANHTLITLTANETDFLVDTGARMDTRMQYRGIAALATQLTIDLSHIRARTIVGQSIGALDTVTSGVRKLTLAVQLGAAAAAPTLSAYAMLNPAPQLNPWDGKLAKYAGMVSRVKARTFNPGGAGEFAFPFEFPRQAGVYVCRIHLSGATVTAARCVKNDTTVWKATAARNNYIQTEFLRTPQANWFVIDFVVDGNMSNMLPLENAKSLETYLTASGAGNIDIITEWLAPLSVG